ncbi:hypothetical protein BD310DRAFT_787854, partial [Dichomitus squalens]
DFEVAGPLGRCKICNTPGQGQWSRLGNLREHEKGKPHRQNLERKLRVAREVLTGASHDLVPPTTLPSPFAEDGAPDPDCLQHDWFPLDLLQDITATGPEGMDNKRARRVKRAMESALAGRISFTAGEESLPGGRDSELSMEDVLAGAGLLRAVLQPEDEDE